MNGIVVTKGISREFDCTPQVRYTPIDDYSL